MNARLFAIYVAVFVVNCGTAAAQQVVVKNKPGEGQWTISYSRRHLPDVFELHTGCKTLAEANAEAQQLIRWSNSMSAESTWRLAIIEIEGEDAPASASDGPKLPGWLELMNDFRAELNKSLPVLEEYMDQIAQAYERAKQAKEGLLKMQKDVTKAVFDRVNGTIADYNNQLDKAKTSRQGAAFARFPRMTPVGPEVLQQANLWRKAKQQQIDLEGTKARLDDEKQPLTGLREQLIQEDRDIRAEEERIAALEPTVVAQNNNGSLSGPFTLYTGQYSNTRGSKRGEFQSFSEARSTGEGHMSQNASRQPNYRIVDSNGTDIEYDGLLGSKKVSQEAIRSSEQSGGGEQLADVAEFERAKARVDARREALNKQVTEYKARLERYNRELQQFEQANRSHKTQADSLSNLSYRTRAVPRTRMPSRLTTPR